MNPQQSEKFDKLLKYLIDAGERNITEKRKNFEHLTLLTGTILGFSVGLATASSGETNCYLIISWVMQVLTITVGSFFLILETESRYSRIISSAGKQAELINVKTEEELKQKARDLFAEAQKLFLVSAGKNLKEKIFITFTKYQRHTEFIFYLLFILSLAFLVLSFI